MLSLPSVTLLYTVSNILITYTKTVQGPFFLFFTSGRELLGQAGDGCTSDVVEILTMTYNGMGSIFRTAKNKPNCPPPQMAGSMGIHMLNFDKPF